MKQYFFVLFFLISSVVYGQGIFEEKYDDCKTMDTCLYCGDTPARYSKDLTDYFKWKIEHATHGYHLKSGSVFFDVHIDSSGEACVLSINDKCSIGEMKNDLRQWINQMTDWKPAVKNNQPINTTIALEFEFIANWLNVSMTNQKKSSQNRRVLSVTKSPYDLMLK